MKRLQNLIAKFLVVSFIITNIFACMPGMSFAANEVKNPRISYEARAKAEIIVKFKDDKKIDSVRSNVKGKLKLSKLDRKMSYKRQKIDVLEIGTADNLDKVIQELKKDPDVEYAQPNYKLQTTTLPSDSRFNEQWGLQNVDQVVEGQKGRVGVDINAINAWNITRGTSSAVIGVLDTGIDIEHSDLTGNIFTNPNETAGNGVDDDNNGYIDDVHGWDFANDDNNVDDDSVKDRHGTYTAGIIAASTNSTGITGVAPGVRIVPLKFINGDTGYTCDAINAIEYAMNMNIGIINCSFGGTDDNLALKDAMKNSGILFVCSAGNRGGDVTKLPVYPACFNIPNVLSVAAVDGNGVLAPFSSYGLNIDVAAPGTNILSTTPDNNYDYFSGTSASAPFVTGIAALIKSYLPNSSITNIKDRIKNNVVSCTNLANFIQTGGRVDANAALTNTKPQADTYNGPGQNIDTLPVGNQDGFADTWYTQDQWARISEKLHYGESGVNKASGNYSFTCTDMSVPAPGFQINISRTYNSRNEKDLPMGRGWTFGFEGSAAGREDNLVEVSLPTGAVERFRWNGEKYEAQDSRSEYAKETAGTTVLTTKDRYKYRFGTDGLLINMIDRNGNIVTIKYDDKKRIDFITDTVGRKYEVEYDPTYPNLIGSITDEEGRQVIYHYNSDCRLEYVKDPSGSFMYYEYDPDGFLNKIKDHNGKSVVSLTYNHAIGENQHKVYEAIDQNGLKINYSYNVENEKKTLTDTNGRTWSYWYKTTVNDENGKNWTYWFDETMYSIREQDPEGKYTYTEYFMPGGKNRFGDMKSFEDRNGNVTEYKIDINGNTIEIKNPDGGIKTFLYDLGNNNLKYEIDERGRRTDYIYYPDNRNLKIKARALNGSSAFIEGTSPLADYAITTYAYYTTPEAISLFTCPAAGLLKSETNPLGNTSQIKYASDYTTTYEYDRYGNTTKEIDPEGNFTTKHYNKIGWMDYSLSPGGHRTIYEYDRNGQLERTILEKDETTRTVYDAVGRKKQEISPKLYNFTLDDKPGHKYNDASAGSRYDYYDSGELKSVTDALNNKTTYEYDKYGNLTKTIRSNGSILGYAYDKLDRLTREYYKDSDAAAEQLLKEYSYSILSDNRTQKTELEHFSDTETATTVYIYDYADRLVEQQNPDGTKVKTVYDYNGNILSTTAEDGSTTAYAYDGLNRLIRKWVPLGIDNGYTYYSYYETVYDIADRKTHEISSADKVLLNAVPTNTFSVDYTYKHNDLVETVLDSDGRKTIYQYDNDLNVEFEIINTTASETLATQYSYNHLNKVVDKKVHARAGDLVGNSFGSTAGAILLTHYDYDKNGNVETVADPDLDITTYTYDALDQLVNTKQNCRDEYDNVSVVTTSSISYDWEGNVLEKADAYGRKTVNTYNQRGFLIKVTDPIGVAAYEYDRAGRKIAEVSPKNYEAGKAMSQMSRTEYVYDAMSRIKAEMERYKDNAGIWHEYYSKVYRYDNSGNISKELNALGYETASGNTLDEKILSGYGTEYAYNYQDKVTTMLDPESKARYLPFTVEYDYDGMGRKISETNANGVITKYEMDGAGNVLSIKLQKSVSSVSQNIETNAYDLKDRLLSKTDGNGNTITFEYNVFDKVRKAIYPGDATIPSNTIQYQYDKQGNLKLQQDSTDKVVTFDYDNQNRLLSQMEKKSDGTQAIIVSNKYDLNGNVRFKVDGNGNITENTYDLLNRLKTAKLTVNGVLHTTAYGYDNNGNQTSATDWLGNTSSKTYDALNRLIEVKDTYGITVQQLEYNNNDVQVKSCDAFGYETSFEYDKNNRLVSTTDPEMHVTGQRYDNIGNVSSKADGRGNTTNYIYDEFNRLSSVTNARGETTSYTYDLNGNMLSQKDGRGLVTLFEYNAAGKPSRKTYDGGRLGTPGNYTYLDEKVESYTYYSDGSMKTKKDRNGKTTNYVYDIHGRLTSESIGTDIISYVYDNNGNQIEMTDSTGTTVRTYDGLNRALTKTVPGFSATMFEYDLISGVDAGFVKERTTDPKGNITEKVMDKAGRLKQVTAEGQTTTYDYYVDGSRKSVLYPNGSKEEYAYYKNKLVQTLKNTNVNGTVIDEYSYIYDEANNQTTKQDKKGKTYYGYDALNRLDSVTEPNQKWTTYIYDKSGNRESETITFGESSQLTAYAYDEQNRLTASSTRLNGMVQDYTYSYDANGNMVCKTLVSEKPLDAGEVSSFKMEKAGTFKNSDAAFYEYDVWNQLVKTTESYNTAAYKYNGDGLRVEKTKTELATLLTDDFNGGLDKWASTSNATISGGQLKVVNNESMRSASQTSGGWDDFILEVDVKIVNTSAGLVFRSSGSNSYMWQLTTESGGKLKPSKIVNGTAAAIKEVAYPFAQNVWYHIKIQASGTTIKTYVDSLLVDTTTDSTYASGNVGFRQTATAAAVFDNYSLIYAGASTTSTTRYLYEDNRVVLETNASGIQTARNIYGTNLLARRAGTDLLYYMYNAHADVTALIKDDGTLAASYYYDAFGTIAEQTGSVNNSILYAGYQYDSETGLYYLNARYYDSRIARFLSEDTYTGELNDPLSLNLYTYCHNEPIMYTDLTGHMPFSFRRLLKDEENEDDESLDFGQVWEDIKSGVSDFGNRVASGAGSIYNNAKEDVTKFGSEVSNAVTNYKDTGKGIVAHHTGNEASSVKNEQAYEFGKKIDEANDIAFAISSLFGGAKSTKIELAPETAGAKVKIKTETKSPAIQPKKASSDVNSKSSSITSSGAGQAAKYGHLEDPKNVGQSKDFTPAQKNKVIQENKKMNDGVVKSDQSKTTAVKPAKSQKNVTPPKNEWQIDHIIPKDKGGTNSYKNAQVLTREENRLKSNK
jgi:RHS repeat-associated protein